LKVELVLKNKQKALFAVLFILNCIKMLHPMIRLHIVRASILLGFGLLPLVSNAQDCTVTVDSLVGKYTGDCKKGKAEGMGRAEGKDTYVGMFKAGRPDGQGKYSWKSGNWFEGQWVKGLQDGEGTMVYKLPHKDSIVTGFWKKGKYIGLYEKPYLIHKRSQHITDVTCKKENNTMPQIRLFLNSETGGLTTSFNSQPVTKPEISDIQVTVGTFLRRVVNDSHAKKTEYLLEAVSFPFRAMFTVNNGFDFFEIEILEAGNWSVEVRTSF
jgi:hypothetical protein